MKQSNYIAAEFKRMIKKRSVLLSVGIVLLVPLVYAMIMLSPKWGPQDNIDNLPIAVVNNDSGATSDGELVNIGDELVDSLQSNRTLGWDFVSSEEAIKGMDDMKYYMKIEVPEEFSKKALTVLDDTPENPELKFTQNEGLHYMAATVTNSAIETIKGQLSAQITEMYVQTVVDKLGGVADGFSEAAEGADQINDGTGQLKAGSEEMLLSLTEKSSDIARLANGAKELNVGTQTLKDSLVSKQGDISTLASGSRQLSAGTSELLGSLKNKSSDISKLADGANQVNDGTGLLLKSLNEKSSDISGLSAGASELAKGASDLKDGTSELSTGAKAAKAGSSQLKAGLDNQLVPGSVELAAGVLQAQQGVNKTIEDMELLYSVLQMLGENYPELKSDTVYNMAVGSLKEGLEGKEGAAYKRESFKALVAGANQLRDGLAKESDFNKGLTQLDAGLSHLVGGTGELSAGASKLADGAKQVADGNQTVASGWNELQKNVTVLRNGTQQVAAGNTTVKGGWSDLQTGATELHDGASQISAGNQTVESGWRELSAGATDLHDGSTQIRDGNETIKTGWITLTDGVTQVDDGLLQVFDGSGELHKGLVDGAEQAAALDPKEDNIAMFAQPVVLDGEVINSFPFYRDANAPYIITLALFVGILAMSFVVPYRKPAILPPSALAWFTGKVTKLAAIATVQALIISLYSLLVLKIQVHSSLLFIIYSIWVSLTFLMIVLFLVVLAGNIGRFIALAFAVVQLSTTGSALPIHMLPEGLRNLSVFLPFTYSIDGFKNIITLGKTSIVWANGGVLFLYLATFGILSAVVFFIRYRRVQDEMSYEEEPTESAI